MTDAALQPEVAPTAAQQRYTAVAIGLHWAIALLIVGLLAVGWIMDDFIQGGPGSPKSDIIQLHKSFGITVLLLTIVRIAWRLMNPPPPEPPMPPWQKLLSTSVHVLLYAVMLAMPLTGWIMASAGIGQHETRFFGTFEMYVPGIPGLPAETREPIREGFEQVHHNLAWVIVGLLLLHVAGAVKHQFIDKDGLMARIAPGVFGHTAGAPDKGHGALWAFGAAALVFAIVAGLSMSAASPAGPAIAQNQQQAPPGQAMSKAPAWAVDPAKSTLAFTFGYMGTEYTGKFPDWTAQIQLDTDAGPNTETPIDGYVRVVIPMGKVDTGQDYFNGNVVQGDWFDVAKFPEAVFEVTGGVYKMSPTTYEATGVLTLKGEKHPVRLPFTLDVQGNTATMHGEVTLARLDLGVGKATKDKGEGDEEWVADPVKVVIDIVATKP